MAAHILAIDQGTSATKCILVDAAGRMVAKATAPLSEYLPLPGWVEQDAEEIWQSVLQAQPSTALLRWCLVTALALAPGRICQRVTFVEHDHSVEVRTQPIDDLLHARNPFLARVDP